MAFTGRPGAEVERLGNAPPAAVPELEPPKAVNNDGSVVTGFEQAPEPAVGFERHDCAAAKVADQQFVRVFAEGAW